VGPGVGGDAHPLVGRQDGPVEGGLLVGGDPSEEARHQGVEEQGLIGEGLRSAGPRDIQGVQPLVASPHPDDGPADDPSQAPVLVLRVDDQDLDPGVQGPEDLDLRQVALPGSRPGQDDLVVVLQGEPVQEHQPPGGGVASQEDPASRLQLGAGERERGRQGSGVEGPADPQGVDAQRERGDPPL